MVCRFVAKCGKMQALFLEDVFNMQLTAIGLNHQTAPISIRERLAFAAQVLPEAVKQIVQKDAAREAVILSTCNRTELYCVGQSSDIVGWLADFHRLPEDDIRPYLYTLDSDETIRHAFRVSCGLDSMVLGEPQILGQLKDAVRVAQEQSSIDTTLNTLFQKTFSVAKEVRSNTAVGNSSVSMAAASVKMAEQIFPKIADLNVLFIGAGEMIELVATYFSAKSPKKITVANRTLARARELCAQMGGRTDAVLLNDLPGIIHEYDVIVSSTASPLPIVGKGMIESALKQRRRHPMFLLDLAVPRDIEPEVGKIEDAYLYTLDSDETIRHAFRVSCGLDSMVLGEPQILGQLKDAVRVAQEQSSIDTTLNTLFQKTFSVAKEVRSNTAVGNSSVSMAAASVKMAEQIFPKIADLNVLFIGAGEMIELVATYFSAKNPKKITVANRTLARARELCAQMGGRTDAVLLNDLPGIIHEYDVIVSSTASPLPIVGKGMIESALKQRRRHPMFLLDLAVPRDIEPEVGKIEDAYLYTVDDMVKVVEMGKEARQQAAAEAEAIIDTRVHEFLAWQRERQIVPMIKALRDEGETQRQQALATALKQLHKGVSAEEVLEKLSLQLTNKLLHAPTVALHQINQRPELSDAVSSIYRLPEHL